MLNSTVPLLTNHYIFSNDRSTCGHPAKLCALVCTLRYTRD